MNEHLEPTVLPFNKNKDDKSEMIRENISINKSLVDDLCARDGLESWSCFLSATVVVLTKYTNSTNVLISTNINSRDVCLSFNDENRKKNSHRLYKEYGKTSGPSDKPLH